MNWLLPLLPSLVLLGLVGFILTGNLEVILRPKTSTIGKLKNYEKGFFLSMDDGKAFYRVVPCTTWQLFWQPVALKRKRCARIRAIYYPANEGKNQWHLSNTFPIPMALGKDYQTPRK